MFAPDLERTIERYMLEAIELEENRNEDGSINWNFVDADVYMRLNPVNETVDLYMEIFDKIAYLIEEKAA
jgi:hypothetical protein